MLVMSAFVRSLRATQARLRSIDRGASRERGLGLLLAAELALEYLLLGIFSTVTYGVLPSFVALLSLAWNGHRVAYISAAAVTAGNSRHAAHEGLSCGTAKTSLFSLRSM